MPRGPNPRMDNFSAANQMFTGGVDAFTGAMDKYAGRLKNRAVNQLLGGYSPDSNDLMGSQQGLMQQLAGVGGITPVEALGLSTTATQPYTAQRDYNFGLEKFGEIKRHNLATEANSRISAGNANKPYTDVIYDENPYTGEKTPYQYNKKSENPTFNKVNLQSAIPQEGYIEVPETSVASYSNEGEVVQAGQPQVPQVTYSDPDKWGVSMGSDGTFKEENGNYVIPMNLREVKEIKLADGTTSHVVINKATGRDASGNPVGDAVQPVKPPTMTDTDKKVLDNVGVLNDTFSSLNNMITGEEDIFGPIASWFDRRSGAGDDWVDMSGVGQLFATRDSKIASLYDAEMNKVKATVIKSMGANPSDRDLKTIDEMLPQRVDEPEVAKIKLQQFRDWSINKQVNNINRLLNTNRKVTTQMLLNPDGTIKKGLVPGYSLHGDTETGEYIYIKNKEQ